MSFSTSTPPQPVQVHAGWGVAVGADLSQAAPVRIWLRADGATTKIEAPYAQVTESAEGFTATATVPITPTSAVRVDDVWSMSDTGARLQRTTTVEGDAAGGFSTQIMLRAAGFADWERTEVFAPGVAYGDAELVHEHFLGGITDRRGGVRTLLVREDRLSAPVVALRAPSGDWVAVLDEQPDARTIVADGAVENGDDTLIDDRLRVASLGGRLTSEGLEIGLEMPGSEGEHTYSTGGLPLLQLDAWRSRFHPIVEGQQVTTTVRFLSGTSDAFPAAVARVWAAAWSHFSPRVTPIDIRALVATSTAVLASQVRSIGDRVGVPLEADAADVREGENASQAVMGFVGANTDAAAVLLRVAELDPAAGSAYRSAGLAILDTFTRIPMDPPESEGFFTTTGEPATYRSYRGQAAVYARSLAEGALAVADALEFEQHHGREQPAWQRWIIQVAEWLVDAQEPAGGIPRAWTAGTGHILDPATNASFVAVPFLVAAGRLLEEERYLDAAERAAEFIWREWGARGAYAGATLDNPNVVDKEASVLSAEGFVALHDATGDPRWLDRAVSAASIAATWIYIWNVPMPDDASDADLHWKRGVSTVGHQLITTGASMTDGFLAVNAAVFSRLWELTGDDHWLDVARLVVHGTTAMTATATRPFDLRGPGWQQEHWSFAPRRGYGLNRKWLPWVPVAHVRGIHRVEDLGPTVSEAVLGS